MFTHLKDIVRYVHDTGFFENVLLVVKDDGQAAFTGMSRNSTLKIKALYKSPLPQLREQKLGLARMDVLSAFLRSPAFSTEEEGATPPTIEIIRRPRDNHPAGIELKSSRGHSAVFRFMSPQVAKSRITVTRSNASIEDSDIQFQPSETFLRDFVAFSSVLRKFNTNFSLEVSDGTLYMNLGDDDSARLPVTTVGENQNINPTYTWPIENMLKVLKQAPTLENVTIGVSEEYGMIEIVIDDENVSVTYNLLHN